MPHNLKGKHLWLVRDSAGDLFVVATDTTDTEEVYRVFGAEQLDMDVSGDFDAGNVDIDLTPIPATVNGVASLKFEE